MASPPRFTISRAQPTDLDEIAEIWCAALAPDSFFKTLVGTMTPEQTHAYVCEGLKRRLTVGQEIGHSQVWKIVDGNNGQIAAWTGLFVPCTLTDAQKQLLKTSWDVPAEGGIEMCKWWMENVVPLTTKYGYDGTKHYHRAGSMVRPGYQGQGLMRQLTKHCNAIADAAGKDMYAPARPGAAGVFFKEGFEVKGWVDCDMRKFGGEKGELANGGTRFWCLLRKVGAQERSKEERLTWE